MALWDVMKGVGSAVGKSVVKTANEMQESRDEWAEKYARMSNEQLKREYEKFRSGGISGSTAKKSGRMAAFKNELRSRGIIND